jgi:hypothetical protein
MYGWHKIQLRRFKKFVLNAKTCFFSHRKMSVVRNNNDKIFIQLLHPSIKKKNETLSAALVIKTIFLMGQIGG